MGFHSLLQGIFPEIQLRSPALQADSLPSEPPEKPRTFKSIVRVRPGHPPRSGLSKTKGWVRENSFSLLHCPSAGTVVFSYLWTWTATIYGPSWASNWQTLGLSLSCRRNQFLVINQIHRFLCRTQTPTTSELDFSGRERNGTEKVEVGISNLEGDSWIFRDGGRGWWASNSPGTQPLKVSPLRGAHPSVGQL